MGTRMKGLLKGLRYISNIFDGKEQEMQIGYPTDVKHVAHIGWDGPSVKGPSWMKEFQTASTPPTSSSTGKENDLAVQPKCLSQDFLLNGGAHDCTVRDLPAVPVPRPSRRKPSIGGPSTGSPNQDPSGAPRHTRRHQSSGGSSAESSAREFSEVSRRNRRERSSNAGSGGSDTSSTLQDLPANPKQSRRRKTKGSSSCGVSSRSSRSKDLASCSDQGTEDRSIEQQLQLPPLKPMREEEEDEEEGR